LLFHYFNLATYFLKSKLLRSQLDYLTDVKGSLQAFSNIAAKSYSVSMSIFFLTKVELFPVVAKVRVSDILCPVLLCSTFTTRRNLRIQGNTVFENFLVGTT